MKAPARLIRHLALATTVLGMAHCPSAAARQIRHHTSHLMVVTHHSAARRQAALPAASFPPDPAGLALLLNPDALVLAADTEESGTVLTARPPVALADLGALRAPPIVDLQPALPPPPVARPDIATAGAPPPIFIQRNAAVAVAAPPIVLAQATPLPVPPPPPPAPVIAPPPPPPPFRMAAIVPPRPPLPVPPPPRRVATRRVYAMPARTRTVVNRPRTYYAPRYEEEPQPPPYGVLMGPPRGYGYGYWGGYGYY